MDYKKIRELADKNLSYGEIADIVGADLIDVVQYLEGLKTSKNTTKISEAKHTDRRSEVRSLFLDYNMSVGKIAEKLKVSKSLVMEDLISMGLNPYSKGRARVTKPKFEEKQSPDTEQESENITSQNISALTTPQEDVKERRKTIAKLYEEGIPLDVIYAVFKTISPRIIDRDLKYIEEHEIIADSLIGKENETTQSVSSASEKKKAIKERRELVAILFGKMPNTKIAKALGVSTAVIQYDIKVLIASGVIEDRRESEVEERRWIVASLYGKMYISEIAEKLGVSVWNVNSDVKYLKEQGIIDRKELKRWNF